MLKENDRLWRKPRLRLSHDTQCLETGRLGRTGTEKPSGSGRGRIDAPNTQQDEWRCK